MKAREMGIKRVVEIEAFRDSLWIDFDSTWEHTVILIKHHCHSLTSWALSKGREGGILKRTGGTGLGQVQLFVTSKTIIRVK